MARITELPVNRTSVWAEVAARIESFIDAELTPGSRLPTERELASQFAVSRTTVRQALADLEQRRRIERRQGRGTTVLAAPASVDALRTAIDRADPEAGDVAELRDLLEPQIAGLAALRASGADLVLLADILSATHDRVTPEESLRLDLLFHHQLALATRNPLLVTVCDSAAELGAPVRAHSHASADGRRSSAHWHRRIYHAVSAHDPEAATEAMRGHLGDVAALIRKGMNRC